MLAVTGQLRESFGLLSQGAGGTMGAALDGRVLEMRVLIGVTGIDGDLPLDIVRVDFVECRVKLAWDDQ